ncbi:WD40 repeat-like protein [Suillus hirtellus]|nr:WD40 repeat-like protein [Suillus hirtellus]
MSSSIVRRQETSRMMPHQKFEGHANWVRGVIHLPGGQRIMTCSLDGSLRVWDLKSGKQIGDDWRDGDSPVYALALSPDGKKVASGSEDGGVRLWNMDTGKVIMKWMGYTKAVNSVCWSGDSQRVLSGFRDGTARQWDVESGDACLALIKANEYYIWVGVYSPDMTMFATSAGTRQRAKIWDARTGKLVAALEIDMTAVLADKYVSYRLGCVESIAISPNGRILASASHDGTARLWNLDNNQPIGSPLQHPHVVRSVSFSAYGKLLVTGCSDNNAYTWDVSGMLKEASLSKLLLDKSVLAHPQSWASRASTLRDRLFSFFYPDAHDTSSRPHPFHWVRYHFSGRSTDEYIELRKRSSAVVDVPYAKGKRPSLIMKATLLNKHVYY